MVIILLDICKLQENNLIKIGQEQQFSKHKLTVTIILDDMNQSVEQNTID